MANSKLELAAILATALSCASASDAIAAKVQRQTMGTKNLNRVEKLFEHTKTVCVGRFVLDVPETARVTYGPAELPYSIERIIGRGSHLDEIVEKRKQEIFNEDRQLAWGDLASKASLLGKVILGSAPHQKIVFAKSRSSGSHYMLQSYQRVGDDIYVQEVVAYGNGYSDELNDLNSISLLLEPRSDDDKVHRPGICFDGALVREPRDSIFEYVTVGVRLEEFRDVNFSIEMTKKDRAVPSDALEPRILKAEIEARKSGNGKWYDKVKVFRQGSRQVGNWTGFEYLAWKPALGKEHESHVFAYVAVGEPSNPMLPVLDIALDTGVRGNEIAGGKPSLTDDEALCLWDSLTHSIRARPLQSNPP